MQSPLILGVVGDSGSGKTTLVRGVVRRLGRSGVTPLCLDDYHRFNRAEREALGLTALDPAANDLAKIVADLAALRRGELIQKAIYDHRTGTLRGPERVQATGLVIAYGLLTLREPALRELFDLSIYLDPAPDLQRSWRITRDIAERGYTSDQVLAAQPARERDAVRFVHSQRRNADLVISFFSSANPAVAPGLRLTVRRELPFMAALPLPREARCIADLIDEDGRTATVIELPPGLAASKLSPLSTALHAAFRFGYDADAPFLAPNLTFAQDFVAAALSSVRSGLQ